MNLQHDEGQVSNVIMDQRQTRNRVQQAIRKPTYMQYVRKRMAEMDYYNGLRTAKERGAKNTAIQKDIEWILALHNMGLPFEKIAQAAHKTVDEVINIIDNEQLRRGEKRD